MRRSMSTLNYQNVLPWATALSTPPAGLLVASNLLHPPTVAQANLIVFSCDTRSQLCMTLGTAPLRLPSTAFSSRPLWVTVL